MACAFGQRLKSVVAFLSSVFVLGLRSKGDKVPLRAPACVLVSPSCSATQLASTAVALSFARAPRSAAVIHQCAVHAAPSFVSASAERDFLNNMLSIEWDFGGSRSLCLVLP